MMSVILPVDMSTLTVSLTLIDGSGYRILISYYRQHMSSLALGLL